MNRSKKLLLLAVAVLLVAVVGAIGILRTDSASSSLASGDDSVTITPADIERSITIGGPAVESIAAAADLERRTAEYVAILAALPPPPPPAPAPAPKPAPAPTRNRAPVQASTPAPAATGGVNAFLECVAKYESGSNYSSHTANGSGGKYGALVSSWNNAYGVHYPYQATPAQQDAWAQNLYNQSGSRPWSTRGKCGG